MRNAAPAPPQARVERMEQFQKEKEELDRGCRECKRKVAECQRKLKELEVAEGGQAELERLQAEAQQLRKEERSWEQKLEEMRKKEKSMPWNVDTLSKDGFSKVRAAWAGARARPPRGAPEASTHAQPACRGWVGERAGCAQRQTAELASRFSGAPPENRNNWT